MTSDVADIINVINLYPIAVDSLQFDLFDRIFTEDANVGFGGPAGWTDLVALKRDFETIHRPFEATQHVTTNHQVVVQGDHASCISYVHGRFIRTVPEGGNMFESTGWYDDQLVRTPAGWRINVRNCCSIWSGGNPAVLQTMPGVSGEQTLVALSREAAAGRLAHLKVLDGKF